MFESHSSIQSGFFAELDKRSIDFQARVFEVLQLLEDYERVKLLGEGKDIGGVIELVNFLNENNCIQILKLETLLTDAPSRKSKGMIQVWTEITKALEKQEVNPKETKSKLFLMRSQGNKEGTFGILESLESSEDEIDSSIGTLSDLESKVNS